MTIQPRLVVTGREPDGTSVFVADQPGEPIAPAAFHGSEFFLLWGTEDGTAQVGTKPRQPKLFPYFPGAGGTRILLLRWAPRSSAPQQASDPAAEAAEAAETAQMLPGLLDVFEPGHGGMHTTDSVDYGICLEGELYLELDNGEEVLVTPGTVVVQQGTRHAWHNRSDQTALMCYVLIGAERDS
jgi:quercetin dioxygenase-like cupin family protein